LRWIKLDRCGHNEMRDMGRVVALLISRNIVLPRIVYAEDT
jgi:hypothetical protein